jgi:PKD repeat protein/ribosomal protein L21E
MNKNNMITKRLLVIFIGLMILKADWIFAIPEACEFYGTGKIRGVSITPSDIVKAYDENGQYLATHNMNEAGWYNIQIEGESGDLEGTQITFKINDEEAIVTSGSDIWNGKDVKRCDIEVPDDPPVSDPGGPYTGEEGTPVNFDGSGSTNAVTYEWDFGDGSTGSGVSPSHTYVDEGSGSYTVKLKVKNASQVYDEETTTANISNANPIAEAGSNKNGDEGRTLISFSGQGSDAGSQDVLSYSWNFGDGHSSTGQNVTHTYMNNANYNAVLTVTDNDEGSGNDNVTVAIQNVAPENVNAGNNQTVNEGQPVNFSGSATDPGDDVLSYSWNFDDGHSLTGPNTSHVYADNDVYNVVLTVNDGDANSTDNLSVTVNNVDPVADAGGPYDGIINQAVQFHGSATDDGSNDVLTFNWDLDEDGLYDDFTGTNPTKTYYVQDSYIISLKVTDGDGGEDIKNANVEISEGVEITFETSPPGLKIKVDGTTHTTPKKIKFPPGSQHSVDAIAPQSIDANSRYWFASWSDGKSKYHNITIPYLEATYTANFKYQYLVKINTGGVDANPSGAGWYDEGSTPFIEVDNEVTDEEGTTRYQFDGWTGTGMGHYTGPDNPVQIRVNSPIEETVNWNIEYKLDVQSDFGTTQGSGWYTSGTEAIISVDSLINKNENTRYDFAQWSGEGSGKYTGPDNPAVVTMNGPIVETAIWNVQYYLDIVSDYGDPQGEGWYSYNETASVSINTTVDGGEGAQLAFLSWEGAGLNSYTGEESSFQINMQGPVTETALWKVRYYLEVISDWANTTGTGWYDAGDTVTISIDDTIKTISDKERYRFDGWLGEGQGSYTGNDVSSDIILEGPVKETADWKQQYYVTLDVDPVNAGDMSPVSVPGGWWNAVDPLNLLAMGDADSGYAFSHWTGDTSETVNPLQLILKKPMSLTAHFKTGNVIINTNPSGLSLLIDGETIITPAVYNWLPDEIHSLGVVTPQGDSVSTIYEFVEWSDSGNVDHFITIKEEMESYTAYFNVYYYVQVESDYGQASGEGWYLKGSEVSISVDSLVQVDDSNRQRFSGWAGTGQGSVTGTERDTTVLVKSPITQQAQWESEFRLSVNMFPTFAPGARIDIIPPRYWYTSGETVSLEAVIIDPEYTFLGWTGDVQDSKKSIQIEINSPTDVTANFNTPNLPPMIEDIPDTTILEDSKLQISLDWIQKYIHDPNDPFEYLNFEFESGDHFTKTIDSVKAQINLIPEENWNGEEKMVVRVSDPSGMSAEDTFSVKVISTQDSPGHFSLISPSSDTVLTESDSKLIQFVWGKSENVDIDDAISYHFYISPSPNLDDKAKTVLSDTQIVVFINENDKLFYWGVKATDTEGYTTWCDEVFCIHNTTGVENHSTNLPLRYNLLQNYPNPFNPETTIPYELPKSGNVCIHILNEQGRNINTIVDGYKNAGYHTIKWKGKNRAGHSVGSGVYFVKMEVEGFIREKKIVLIR